MCEYQQYRRTAVAELADWRPGFDMAGVSVSEADAQAGSPKPGDKIARNPANHADRWLIAADYVAANFEPMGTAGGVDLIAAERRRQVEAERWSPEHDDGHTDGSLAIVGAIYALPQRRYQQRFPDGLVEINLAGALWPKGWRRDWYKPTPHDRIRELSKAGALIAAEIDRLLRPTPEQQAVTGRAS